MAQQEQKINSSIARISELSHTIDRPITLRQLDARKLIRVIVGELTYPVNTGDKISHYPAVFNTHPSAPEIEGWALQAANIEGGLSEYGYALSTVLTSVGKAKAEGPIPGKQPLTALYGRSYRLFESTAGGNGWDIHYQATSDVLVRAWATGSTQALQSGIDQYNERLNAEATETATDPDHVSRRARNFILRDIASILHTSR